MLKSLSAWLRRRKKTPQTDPSHLSRANDQKNEISIEPPPAYEGATLLSETLEPPESSELPELPELPGHPVRAELARVTHTRLRNRIEETRVAIATKAKCSDATKDFLLFYLTVFATQAGKAVVAVATKKKYVKWKGSEDKFNAIMNVVMYTFRGITYLAVDGKHKYVLADPEGRQAFTTMSSFRRNDYSFDAGVEQDVAKLTFFASSVLRKLVPEAAI